MSNSKTGDIIVYNLISYSNDSRLLEFSTDIKNIRSNPDDYAYELDIDQIEEQSENPFVILFDKDRQRWFITLNEYYESEDNRTLPQFLINYAIGMDHDDMRAVLQEQFVVEYDKESFDFFYKTKEDAELALEWLNSMYLMAEIGGYGGYVG